MVDYQAVAFASQRLWGSLGGIVLLSAVILGAFGSHYVANDFLPKHYEDEATVELAGHIVPKSYKAYLNYQTAVQYQMIHGVGMVLIGLLGRRGRARIFGQLAGWFFVIGILLFCGTLYYVVATKSENLHLVIPVGGISFLIGWLCFVISAIMPRTQRDQFKPSR